MVFRMKTFSSSEEFFRSVEKDNIVELLFNEDVYFNLSKYVISTEIDDSTIPIHRFVGYYNDVSNLTIAKHKNLFMALRLSDSMFTKVLVGDYDKIVREYRILE